MQLTDLINTRVDERVTQAQRFEYAIDAFQEILPYTVQKNILGEKVYIFSADFIQNINDSLQLNIQTGLNASEQKLFDEYIAFVQYNVIGQNIDIIRQLDDYLGGL